MKYAGLHNHSDYSNIKLLDSTISIPTLFDNAYEKGLSAIALTDHDVLSGHVKAVQYYKDNYKDKDFKLILGNEIYLTREGLDSKNYKKGEKFYHTLLLSKNAKGHRQLRKLSSRAWERSFNKYNMMRTPTYPSDLQEIVGEEPGNIIATTACLGSFTGVAFQREGESAKQKIEGYLESMVDIFGYENFYIEVQPSRQRDQTKYNKFMIKNFWNDYNFVFSTDSHYANQDDAEVHNAFLKSKNGDRETEAFYSSTFIMPYYLIKEFFVYVEDEKLEQMRQNTLKITSNVEDYDLFHEQIVPTVPVDDKQDNNAYKYFVNTLNGLNVDFKYTRLYLESKERNNIAFIAKIIDGFYEIQKVHEGNEQEYFERLEYELEQLWETSNKIEQPISKYFLTMAKMIDIIWEDADSLVGVSRGSAAGFLVNYCLGITQIDPLQQELTMPAWRFIHKDRPGLPDIDIDTEGNKRTKVFNKVREYFKSIGGDVVNVCTFGTEKSKSALRTAARGLEIDDDIVSYVVSLIPNERGQDWTLQECMYGGENKKPIKHFVVEMKKKPKLWKVASTIEGLITRLGVHAAGIVVLNEEIFEYNSMMKTTKGALVSAYNLEDTEYMGGLKYDFLTINALDKIRTTMNLLLEDKQIQWKGGLRTTYNDLLLPANLELENKNMWNMVHQGEIVDLFQFDTPVGSQSVKEIKPENVAELSIANSIMRLMSQDGSNESPTKTYVKYKNNIDLWYEEMKRAGLHYEDIQTLEPYLKPLSGVADSQESVMMMVMDEKIAGFDVVESNALRKAIAKKKKDILEKTKKKYFEKGRGLGNSENILNYVWDYQIARQIGYSFSVLHTIGYSLIAVQEMNLAYRFPLIYWNTACLSVNAGAINEEDYTNLINEGIIDVSDEKDQRKSGKVQYGKIASAIGKFRHELNLNVELPDINIAKFGFTPNEEENSVVFGLKSITKIGDKLIDNIIKSRPYNSLQDFLDKMKDEEGRKLISKDRVVILIKAGSFDKLESKKREDILYDFIKQVSNQKNKVNLQNMKMLIRFDLIPEHLNFEEKVYNFNQYIKKNKFRDNYFIVDDVALSFLEEMQFDLNKISRMKDSEGNTIEVIKKGTWDAYYQRKMDAVRSWMKDNQEELIKKLNNKLFEEEYEKYGKGNKLKWELEALNFYHSGHELEDTFENMPLQITPINKLPYQEIDGYWRIKGKEIPKYKLRHIFGTVLDKDKSKHLITISGPTGIINVKIYRNQFSKFDHTISYFDDDGNKVVSQKSFFKKGTFLVITGIKRGDVFVPKVYKQTKIDPILKITFENGEVLAETKESEN